MSERVVAAGPNDRPGVDGTIAKYWPLKQGQSLLDDVEYIGRVTTSNAIEVEFFFIGFPDGERTIISWELGWCVGDTDPRSAAPRFLGARGAAPDIPIPDPSFERAAADLFKQHMLRRRFN